MTKPLINAFAAAGLASLVSGCSSTPKMITGECTVGSLLASPLGGFSRTRFDSDCADRATARAFIASSNPQFQVLGTTMERNASQLVDQSAKDVLAGRGAEPPRTVKASCAVTKRNENGSFDFSC